MFFVFAGGQDNCVELVLNSGKLSDRQCSAQWPVLCQILS